MKTIKFLISILLTGLTYYVFESVMGVPGISIAIGPLAMIGIGAAAGGLAELLGGDEDDEKYQKLIAYLNKRKGEIGTEANRRKGDLARLISGEVSKRRSGASAVAKSQGKVDPGFAFTKEEDLAYGKIKGTGDIETAKEEAMANIDEKIAMAEFNKPEKEGFLSKVIRGGLTGAGVGANLSGALGLGSKVKTPGAGATPKLGTDTLGSVNLENISPEIMKMYDPELLKLGIFRKRKKSYSYENEDYGTHF